jgi:hypothetical protein
MVAVAMVAVVLACLQLVWRDGWYGQAKVPLRFTVLDAETGRPVSGATIQLVRGPEYLAPPTGNDGRTALIIEARCGGDRGIFGRTRHVNFGYWALHVEAKGYQKFRGSLEKRTSDRRFHEDGAIPPPIVIRLQNQEANL